MWSVIIYLTVFFVGPAESATQQQNVRITKYDITGEIDPNIYLEDFEIEW